MIKVFLRIKNKNSPLVKKFKMNIIVVYKILVKLYKKNNNNNNINKNFLLIRFIK